MPKKLLLLSLLLVLVVVPASAISFTNTRPAVTGDLSALQGAMTAAYGAGAPNATTDQTTAGYWSASGPPPTAVTPIIRLENAGYANSNEVGFFTVSGNTVGSTLKIFNGPASAGCIATVAWTAFDTVVISEIAGCGGAVNAGTFVNSGIGYSGFGFYIKTPDNNTFYTLDDLNAGGNPQALTYRNTNSNLWTIAFEDLVYAGSDKDFDDFVFSIESIVPVPEPGFYGVLALGLSGLIVALRRRSA